MNHWVRWRTKSRLTACEAQGLAPPGAGEDFRRRCREALRAEVQAQALLPDEALAPLLGWAEDEIDEVADCLERMSEVRRIDVGQQTRNRNLRQHDQPALRAFGQIGSVARPAML